MECQCRCGREVAVVVENEQPGQPYRLCEACHQRLERRSLRQLEWFNLASIHSPFKHDLHDDFYSPTGKALQPASPVVREKGWMRAPTLRQCAGDASRLCEYALTRPYLTPNVVQAFWKLDSVALRRALDECLEVRTPNPRNEFIACEIAADALGPEAAEFVRGRLASCTPRTFQGLARAAAGCLPRDEALAWALAYLDGLDAKERYSLKDILSYFEDPSVLDWIETHASEIEVARGWQFLAAASGFSWDRAEDWLRRGRPLSLVALGAVRDVMGLQLPRSEPDEDRLRRLALPSAGRVRRTLEAYLERDSSPNARDQVADILSVAS